MRTAPNVKTNDVRFEMELVHDARLKWTLAQCALDHPSLKLKVGLQCGKTHKVQDGKGADGTFGKTNVVGFARSASPLENLKLVHNVSKFSKLYSQGLKPRLNETKFPHGGWGRVPQGDGRGRRVNGRNSARRLKKSAHET